MLLDDIGTILARAGVGRVMVDTSNVLDSPLIPIFLAYTPDEPTSPDTCLSVFEYAGQLPVMGYTQRLLDMPNIQVLSRAGLRDYQTARMNAQRAYEALCNWASQPVNGTNYVRITPIQSGPELVGYDEKQRPMLTFNMQVVKEPTRI